MYKTRDIIIGLNTQIDLNTQLVTENNGYLLLT